MRTISEILKEVDGSPSQFKVKMAIEEIKANATSYSISEYDFAMEHLEKLLPVKETNGANFFDMDGMGGVIIASVKKIEDSKIKAAHKRGRREGILYGVAIMSIAIVVGFTIAAAIIQFNINL